MTNIEGLSLQRVAVSDFRAHAASEFELPPHGVGLVVGPNNAGKSSLLHAIDVIAGGSPPPDYQRLPGNRSQIVARFTLNEQDRRNLLPGLGTADQLLAEGYLSWIEYTFVSRADGSFHADRLRCAGVNEGEVEIASVAGPSATNQIQINTFQNNVSHGQAADSMRQTHNMPSGDLIQSASIHPSLGGPAELLTIWRSRFFHFDPHRRGSDRRQQMDSHNRLSSDGSNVANVLLYLSMNNESRWEDARRLLLTLVPDSGRLMVPSLNQTFEVAIEDPETKRVLNLKEFGTGVEQLLMLLVLGLTTTGPGVVLVEEPETGLHPGAQRTLLGLLQEWGRDRLFVLTTHSSVFLDWASRPWVIRVRKEAGVSKVSKLDGSPGDLLDELGIRLSDVLAAEFLLIAEGPSDLEILQILFADLLLDPRISLIRGGGGTQAHLAHVLSDWLSQADAPLARSVLFLRDRDELSPRDIERLSAERSVHVLNRREIENYLLDVAAVTEVVNEERRVKGLPDVTEEEVETKMRDAALSLTRVLLVKRVLSAIDRVRLVDQRFTSEVAVPDMTLDVLLARISERMPSEEILATLQAQWEEQEVTIENELQSDWIRISPGADVLNLVWVALLERRYSKSSDGPRLARALTEAPLDLRGTIEGFLAAE